jgi:hypothetical protein
MKTRLLVFTLLALGLQGAACATNPADETQALDRAQPVDEIWGIGLRTANAEASVSAATQEANARANTLAELESAFWACDYVATTRGVDATPVAICGSVYDELKTLKFGGDFGELLVWWKQNKPAEHERLAREERDLAIERVDHR